MKTFTTWLAAASFAATVYAAPAGAGGIMPAAPAVPESALPIVQVQSSCNAIGQQIAAQYGGTLASVRMENRGGQTVCVGTVIVQGKGGERGRVIPFEVPA